MITRPITSPLTQAIARKLTHPGTGGGGATGPLVFVASGQSNMDGAGDGGTMPADNANVQMFDLTTRAFRDLSYTNRISRTNVNTGTTITIPGAAGKNNLAFSFCHAAHAATGRPVYLIISSNGGTHIGRWVGSDASSVSGFSGLWGGVGVASPLYVELKDAVEDALAIIGATKIDAFLWHQGETKRPGFPSPAAYEADFATLRGKLEAESWWRSDTKMLVGEIMIGSYYQDAENYNDFFRTFNDPGTPNIACVSGDGLAMNAAITAPDSVHYDGASLYQFGLRFWDVYQGGSTFLAQRADPDTTLFGVKSVTVDWTANKWQVAATTDPLAGRTLDEKRPAPVRPVTGGYQAGQRVVSASGCSVVHNVDGTFDVTPTGVTAQNWTFVCEDYWQEWPAVSKYPAAFNQQTITGAVDLVVREKLRLSMNAAPSATLNITINPRLRTGTAANDLLEIDWGDGTVVTGIASGANASHTYSSNYTGDVVVYAPGCCELTAITTTGRFNNTVSAFSGLSQLGLLALGTNNLISGDLGDLPASIATVNLGGNNTITWDFQGLPNLKTITAQGASTLNAPSQTTDMVAGIRIILSGASRTTAQVDDILIALATIPTWTGTKDVYLNYAGQAARSAASDAAVATLTGLGVTVVTNP